MNKKIICHNLDNNKFEVEADKLIFRPSVYGILIKNDKILLSKQWDGYDMPGGGVDIHETLEEALVREFFEETGLKVEVLNPVYTETSLFHPSHSTKHKDEFWNCPLTYYLVKQIGGKISKDNFDEEEKDYADLPEWIDLEKVDSLKFFNSVDSASVIKKAQELL
ncbi:MAG: NUDIX domain-containing protein [Patescibacteria group bacterium]|nr:NUDIX domain-containing protein [Patescibacteria group bacterium]